MLSLVDMLGREQNSYLYVKGVIGLRVLTNKPPCDRGREGASPAAAVSAMNDFVE